MPVLSLISNQKVFMSPVEQQVLYNRVAHMVVTTLMLQTFAPRYVTSYH